MNVKELAIKNLCWYDPRHPDYDKEFSEENNLPNKIKCSCDNCFYGRTRLAVEILNLLENPSPS